MTLAFRDLRCKEGVAVVGSWLFLDDTHLRAGYIHIHTMLAM